MSQPSGLEWSQNEFPSPARMNRKTVFSGSDIDVGNIPKSYPGQPIYITQKLDGGSPLLIDKFYCRRSDGEGWEKIGLRKHTHDKDTDEDGGLLRDALRKSLDSTYYVNLQGICRKELFIDDTEDAGASVNNFKPNGNLYLATGSTPASTARIKLAGLKLDADNNVKWMSKVSHRYDTFVTSKFGIGMEYADQNNNSDNKFGFEFCETAGTAGVKWDVTTANNIARSTSATTIGGALGDDDAFTSEFFVGSSCQFWINGNLVSTKTSDIPTTGFFRSNKTFTFSQRTNNSTGKFFDLFALAIAGAEGDEDFK